ncbi:uncharacterized protein BDV14DRAFT_196848 [Aspergillus stella-maris]|uniref:uncharacterized protein n=1 Tax=Aspergillus stella-maris TaxID=1810926 RepID=UPI003CCD3E2D
MDTEDNPPPSSIPSQEPTTEPTSTPEADDYASHSSKNRGKFRFKDKSKSRSKSSRHHSHRSRHDREYDRDRDHDRKREDRHRHRRTREEDEDRRRRHKHRTHRPRTPSPGTVPSYPGAPLSPNTAFRESLFDALGDDEGAAFWESVYGQSVHSFAAPPGYNGHGQTGGEQDGRGELEQMDEEEYAAYVRGEMWKRTREGMLEEQERIRAEKRAKVNAEKAAGGQDERRRFERAMEDSLRRGRERKRMKEVWKGVWSEYIRSWEEMEKVRNASTGENEGGGEIEGKKVRNLLFWPVESGKRRDVSRENVEEFMRRAPPPSSGAADAALEDLLLSTLKTERVRWHPDKIQHRYGALGIDESVLRSVTEVFQIIDHMWNEQKR